MTALLSVQGLRKAYPGVVANDDVSFTVGKGEVHALLGENGAGKSTLVKMVYGLVKPDEGQMTFNGDIYTPGSPHEARSTGVAMVFQHFSLFEALDVAENVALGMENPPPMRELAASIRVSPRPTACRLIRRDWWVISPRVNAKGLRSFAVFYRTLSF